MSDCHKLHLKIVTLQKNTILTKGSFFEIFKLFKLNVFEEKKNNKKPNILRMKKRKFIHKYLSIYHVLNRKIIGFFLDFIESIEEKNQFTV